jgi:cation:H+ antiporter
MLAILALIGGIALLTVCADLAVTAAERLAEHLQISPVVVGALVVGLGTSLPEMVVSGIAAAQRDTVDLAINNVIGSNVANLTLALGLGATITTIHGHVRVMRREGALLIAATALFMVFVYDNTLERWEGVVLLVAMAFAAWFVTRGGAIGRSDEERTIKLRPSEARQAIMRTVIGLVGVLIGAQLMVTGAVDLAQDFGASEAFIGLTIVALGTSLPEVATTVASARRGSIDLVIGNILGSNIFNSLAVAGLAGLVGSGVIEESSRATLWLMLGITVGVVGWGAARRSFGRPMAVLLLGAYAAMVIVGA